MSEAGEQDDGLVAVANWFNSHQDLSTQFARILRRALDEVIDGGRTSRWAVESLEKTEKTYIGTKVEILLKYELQMADGKTLDTLIAGHEVDIKCTVLNNWMIPREAVRQLCLLVRIDDAHNFFQVGLIRTSESVLTKAGNRDGKRSVSSQGREHIMWLVEKGNLPANFLSTIPDDTRRQIMRHRSGQARVNELFRLVQGRIINRNALETVARQLDPMKRMRDARPALLEEGILVLGHQDEDPATASRYDLPVPKKGEAISFRIPSDP